MEKHLKQMQVLLEAGTSFVSVTLVEAKGSTPRAQGGRMLVTDSGLFSGTVGGGLVEAKALEFALDFLAESTLTEQIPFIQPCQYKGFVNFIGPLFFIFIKPQQMTCSGLQR